MSLLTQVRQQYNSLVAPKAISHKPELDGREHIYRQGGGMAMVTEMNRFADYASVYQSYVWAQKAIAKIAENLAGLPLRVVSRDDKPLDGHPLADLFANVNDEETPLDLWSAYVVHMMLGGETFYQIVPDGRGRPAEIWLRRPDQTSVYPDASRLAYPTALAYLVEPELGDPLTIDAPWMVHDKFYNPLNNWRGLAPIQAVREGIVIDLFAQAWSKKFFRNSTRPDFAIIAPQGITQSERNRYEAQFLMEHQGVDKAHLPVILEEGVTDIKTFSFPPKDLEWLQQREFSRDEVGAIFGVPDEIMGYGKDTYENFQTALEVFWTLTMLPLIRRRDAVLTHHFSRYNLGLRPGERFDTDLSDVGVLQEDLLPKAELARKFWEMGVPLNRIDEQLKLGIGPVPGGDVGYLASSYKTIDQVLNPPEPPPPLLPPQLPSAAPPPASDDRPTDDDPAQQRLYLPPGAKEQARRALKKVLQRWQDAALRAIRAGAPRPAVQLDDDEVRRWLGDGTRAALSTLCDQIGDVWGDHDAVNAAYTAVKADENLSQLLEVEAATPFFTVTLPSGAITHDIFKALVLQLDPEGGDESDAEQRVRMELEARFARGLARAFGEQLDTLLPDGAGDEVIRAAASQVAATSEPVREVLRRELERSASLGVTVALDTLEQVGLGFDWTLANTDAARWASQYSYQLVGGINATSQARLQQAVDDWFQERTTLPDLVRELQPTFGRRRAQLIAQTETTRAAAEGSVLGFAQSGVVSEAEWVTMVDERVCPTCGGLHGKRAPLRGTFEGGLSYPPAHPGCRCFVRPVVDEVTQ